jgi:hypothetical protein
MPPTSAPSTLDYADDNGFSLTTASGFEVLFDDPTGSLLLSDRHGSQVELALEDLREILEELKQPSAAGFLRLISSR